MNGKKGSEPTLHQLKVTLNGTKPPIWRRIQVESDLPLNALHNVLQIVMGWDDSHLHMFKVGNAIYSAMNPEMGLDMGIGEQDETEATLADIAPKEGAKFVYEYDFGDSWNHTVIVEKILPDNGDVELPRMLTGKRACPPEDCGGVWGYADLLEVLADPKNPEYADRLEWLGYDYDPEEFDIDAINQQLKMVESFPDILTQETIDMMVDLSLTEIERATTGAEYTRGSGSFVLKLEGSATAFASLVQVILAEYGNLENVKFVIELGPGKDDPLIVRMTGDAEEIDDLWLLLGPDED